VVVVRQAAHYEYTFALGDSAAHLRFKRSRKESGKDDSL
jgi:hypothetical protein